MPQAEIRLKSGRFGQLTGGLGGCQAPGDRGRGECRGGGDGGNGVSMEAAEIMSAFDPAIRQCLLELLHAGRVTCVPRSDKLLRSISLLRCASPASVTRVLSRDNIAEARRSFESSDRRPPAHGAGGRKGAGGRRVRESAGQGRQGVADERANCKRPHRPRVGGTMTGGLKRRIRRGCVLSLSGHEEQPSRIRRIAPPYDSTYRGEPLPLVSVEFRPAISPLLTAAHQATKKGGSCGNRSTVFLPVAKRAGIMKKGWCFRLLAAWIVFGPWLVASHGATAPGTKDSGPIPAALSKPPSAVLEGNPALAVFPLKMTKGR